MRAKRGHDGNGIDEGMRFYLANMSHELRTPMNAIMGLSDLLLRQVKNSEEREYLSSMQTATKNLLMTVNNILDYESMLSGKIKLNPGAFEINSLLGEIISIAKININDKQVRLIVNADPRMPSVLEGDAERIKQVLLHLISNAEKFTREGYIKLSIGYRPEGKKAALRFCVEDTGIGMSEETISKIFTPFEQRTNSFSKDESGLGIGLNIAKALVELLGGKLEADSAMGVGTKMSFELTLPVLNEIPASKVTDSKNVRVAVFLPDKEESDSLCNYLSLMNIEYFVLGNMGELFVEHERKNFSHFFMDYERYLQYRDVKEIRELNIEFVVAVNYVKQVSRESGDLFLRLPFWHREISDILNGLPVSKAVETRDTLSAVGARVLVVDDNDINLRVTEGLLKPFGITVDTASSGEESIRLVSKTKYDLVFMDHMMPEMDGAEATRTIRNFGDPYSTSLPIIALSANVVEGVDKIFKDAGMNDFLAKPVLSEDLEAMLWKWLPKEKTSAVKIAVAEKEEPRDDSFKDFRKIDVSVGLSYTNGNVEMYRAILRDFALSVRDKKQLINELAKSEDIGRFTIEVHSVKSVAKTIGAVSLSEKALELERLGHKRDVDGIHSKLASLNHEFDDIISDLKPFAVREEVHIEKKPVDRDKVRDGLRKIFYAADDFDYDAAREVIGEIGVYDYNKELEALYLRMSDAIEDIDYDGTRDIAIEMLALI